MRDEEALKFVTAIIDGRPSELPIGQWTCEQVDAWASFVARELAPRIDKPVEQVEPIIRSALYLNAGHDRVNGA
jgi:hypothetical protein